MCAKKVTKPIENLLTGEEAISLLKRIEKKEQECQQSRADTEIRKEAYRTARTSYGERVEELRSLCRARKEKHPLFDAAAKQKGEKKSAEQPAGNVAPGDKDAWKTLPLFDLKLPARVKKAISDAGLVTLGALHASLSPNGCFWTKDIKGLGEKGRADVCDVFAAFWQAHPEYCKEKQPVAA